MSYERPGNSSPLTKAQKLDLLKQYAEHYREAAKHDQNVLNKKVPRRAFDDILNRLGADLLSSAKLASANGPVREFLGANSVPGSLTQLLPDHFRAFCLALNALKQWVAAEQAATDRYLLGGNARDLCRQATDLCVVCNSLLNSDCELHHPLRDGRPPVPLCKRCHSFIERQTPFEGNDPTAEALRTLRQESNESWARLRHGCEDLLGQPVPWSSKSSRATARSFAKKVQAETKLNYEQIIEWLDKNVA